MFGGNLFGGKFVWQKICLAEILDWSVEDVQGVRKILVFFSLRRKLYISDISIIVRDNIIERHAPIERQYQEYRSFGPRYNFL